MSRSGPFSPNRLSVDAVVWDYDGTLVDTRAADETAVAELLLLDPGAAAGAELFWAAEGRPIVERIELAWPGRLEELLPLFDRPIRPRVLPGVAAVLSELRSMGLTMAVVSSRRAEPLDWGLRACGLRSAFTTVVGLEDVVAPKPDPEGLLIACLKLDILPVRAVYVGDSEVDVEAGQRAGMGAWWATWAKRQTDGPAGPIELRRPSDLLMRLRAPGQRPGRENVPPPLAAAG
jgi:pyrophosphatase PpaX